MRHCNDSNIKIGLYTCVINVGLLITTWLFKGAYDDDGDLAVWLWLSLKSFVKQSKRN